MKTTRPFWAAALSALLVLSCSRLDVVRRGSAAAFGALLEVLPAEAVPGGWVLNAPGGGAAFFWNGEGAALSVDPRPFTAAGLDLARLGAPDAGDLRFRLSFPAPAAPPGPPPSPLGDFGLLVSRGRESLGYHGGMDHYGLALGEGAVFEWARDMGANDKDLVFALDPGPLVRAGLDLARLEGWTAARLTVDDGRGKPVQVDKLLKAFDLVTAEP